MGRSVHQEANDQLMEFDEQAYEADIELQSKDH